jgi:hypothetical protein
MKKRKESQAAKKLMPDQFLYSRKGPWPQPSPSHPLKCAAEVLNIPPIEELMFNATIGKRYLETQVTYPALAGGYAANNLGWTGPTDERFHEILFDTLCTRYLKPLSAEETAKFKSDLAADNPGFEYDESKNYGAYNFTAMSLIEPLPGTFCAPTQLFYEENPQTEERICRQIVIGEGEDEVAIYPGDSAWGLATIYVLQGAAYHLLFVTHPSLHFPFDSTNAITKSSVPLAHPMFQLLSPHATYSLMLNNSVLESAESVVNNNAQGTRFDPLTGNGYNLKLLFGAGYTGLEESEFAAGYPAFDYMEPQMGFASDYGRWLEDYYKNAFLPMAEAVAAFVLADDNMKEFAQRWGDYNSTYVLGFPSGEKLMVEATLAKALAIYTWNTSIAHGGDHDSFGNFILPVEKCLRIRRAPPKSRDDAEVKAGEIFTGNDLQRAALANEMFFRPWAIQPVLANTYYAFTEPALWAATEQFHTNLKEVAARYPDGKFMPLTPIKDDPISKRDKLYPASARVLPQSIQY